MGFRVGDKVIYPNHGVGVVECVVEQRVQGQTLHFYQLKLEENGSTVLVPIDTVEHSGVRPLCSPGDVRDVMVGLQLESQFQPMITRDWKLRYKENTEKMKGGRLTDVAEVLLALAVLGSRKPLSFREKQMYERAKRVLVAEIAAVEESSESMVEQGVDRLLLQRIGQPTMGSA